jgi:predicted nuclease of predicted toxin-antitoxin system
VKFFVDANLPPDLCIWLRVRGHEAEHLADLNLLTATDTQLWDRGKGQKLVVATKDVDFYDRALILGAPPQVLTRRGWELQQQPAFRNSHLRVGGY